jgi:thiol:disulfide interchange protein DsbC
MNPIKPLMAAVMALAVHTGLQADEAQIKARIAKIMPDTPADSIQQTPVKGIYEVTFGPKIIYMSEDGRYLLHASIVDLETDENITEANQAKAIKVALDKVSQDKMIVFGDPAKAKHTVTVFTDIDCGFCRKLHGEMKDYNDAGIAVRYLFFPRSGVHTPSYDKAVSVWCAKDRNEAMTKAKAGKDVESKKCDNPVIEHMRLGELVGINGTPAIILPSGELVPGYVPAKRLLQYIEGKN